MKSRGVLAFALAGAVWLALAGCFLFTTEIRYEVVGTGTSRVGVISYMDEHGRVEAGPQALPWSYEFDTQEHGSFLAVEAHNADLSDFTDTVTVRILVDGDVVRASTSDYWPMATYTWER